MKLSGKGVYSMNRLDDLIKQVQNELDGIRQESIDSQVIKHDNEIEQQKIIEQNLTIKHTIEQLEKNKKELDDKQEELSVREKQIVIKEKQNLILDQKITELQEKMADMIIAEKKLTQQRQEYEKDKAILDKQTEIYKKLEETEVMRKTRLKLKEEEVDQELDRLKKMSI